MAATKANMIDETACPQCGAPVGLPDYADVAVCSFCGSTLSRDRPPSLGQGVAGVDDDAPAASVGEAVRSVSPSASSAVADVSLLRSVRCSQCAGPLSAKGGRRILVCRHCGTRVAVKEHGGVSRWYFPARVDRLGAAKAGADWLRRYPDIAPRAREARLLDARLVYAPIWEYRTLVAGWEFGYKLRTQTELVSSPLGLVSGLGGRTEDERLELRLVKEGVKEPRLQERRFYQEATDFAALGATRPRVTGRELLLPLLAGELDPAATVLEADGSASAVAERGRRSALQPLAASQSPESHLFTFRESTSLLYYPLWLLRYQAGEDYVCRLTVDGRDGTVNSGFAPADDRRRVAFLGLEILLAAALVALFLWLAVTHIDLRLSMVAAAVVVSVVAALSVSRSRRLREVEYHEPFSG